MRRNAQAHLPKKSDLSKKSWNAWRGEEVCGPLRTHVKSWERVQYCQYQKGGRNSSWHPMVGQVTEQTMGGARAGTRRRTTSYGHPRRLVEHDARLVLVQNPGSDDVCLVLRQPPSSGGGRNPIQEGARCAVPHKKSGTAKKPHKKYKTAKKVKKNGRKLEKSKYKNCKQKNLQTTHTLLHQTKKSCVGPGWSLGG